MVQDQGDVANARRFFRTAKGQIVWGGETEGGPKAADLPHHSHVEGGEIADVIHGAEGFGRPVRLEDGVAALAVLVEGVLVGIDEVGPRLDGERVAQHGDGGRRQQVAGVKDDDEAVRDALQGRVPGVGVGRSRCKHLDPCVVGPDRIPRRHPQSPVRIALSKNRRGGRTHGGPVAGQEEMDARRLVRRGRVGRPGGEGGRLMPFHPAAVGLRFRRRCDGAFAAARRPAHQGMRPAAGREQLVAETVVALEERPAARGLDGGQGFAEAAGLRPRLVQLGLEFPDAVAGDGQQTPGRGGVERIHAIAPRDFPV